MSENDEVVEKIQNEIKELEEKLTVTSAKRKTLERMMELINKEVADTESMIQQTRAGLGLPPTASVDNNGVTTSGASNGSRRDSIKHSTGPSAAAVASATNAGGEERRTGICATIDPFMPLIEDIPSLRVMPLDPSLINVPVRTISGPIDPYVITNPLCEVVDTIVAARTVSTYPMITSSGTKQGNPICDRYRVEVYNNRITVSIGDGCNWGERPMEAAQKATEGFMAHVGIHSPSARTTKDMGRILLEGVAAAHNSVIAGKPEINDAGTTTLIGATIFPMQESYTRGATAAPAPTEGVPESNAEPGTDFGVCIVSVGDCKCFLWDVATKRVRDITCGNRGNITDASDPGGRLGPFTDSGLPDTRNLQLFFTVCHTNDLLIFCSDGVHDNLDCSSLGVLPGELCEDFEGMSWVQASEADLPLAEDIKIAFYEARLGTLINSQYPKHCAHAAGDPSFIPPPFLPKDIVDFLSEYCMRTTFASRQFMETHPNKKLPSDYKRFPGKMDHTTTVIVRVDNPIKKSSAH